MATGQYQNPYQQGPGAEQGYGYGHGQEHEMQNYQQPGASQTMDRRRFYDTVQSVKDMLDTLVPNARLVGQRQKSGQNVEAVVAEIDSTKRRIAEELRVLDNDWHQTTDSGLKADKKNRLEVLKRNFATTTQEFQVAEADNRAMQRQEVARQYRIVNPNASEDEVRQATESSWEGGIFKSALLSSKSGQAASVLQSVNDRHAELQKIERDMMELTDMFKSLAIMVEQQEDHVAAAETNADKTGQFLDQGNVQVKKGIISARNARKWKWWCLLITILIIAIAVGLGVGLTLGAPKTTNA
ncbi:t-SNARE [Xylariaceae sp. FL0016]|nr:t-SNARE [Xylariaceae sp. FL0016]